MTTTRPVVPDRLRDVILSSLGEVARPWLADLPVEIAAACDRWSLVPDPPFADLSYAWVAPVRRPDGSRAVLKLPWPDSDVSQGISALRVFGGRGSVQLIAADDARGWLLLEHVVPGVSPVDLDDDSATRAFAAVVRDLHGPPPPEHRFSTVGQWWRRGLEILEDRREAADGVLPRDLVRLADRLFAELEADGRPEILLHGDLHHRNILSSTRAPWLAIDPKGVVGDPSFEPGAWLRNPLPERASVGARSGVLRRRLDVIAAETDLDRSRVRAWSVVGTVLSAIWSLEGDRRILRYLVDCARILARPDL